MIGGNYMYCVCLSSSSEIKTKPYFQIFKRHSSLDSMISPHINSLPSRIFSQSDTFIFLLRVHGTPNHVTSGTALTYLTLPQSILTDRACRQQEPNTRLWLLERRLCELRLKWTPSLLLLNAKQYMHTIIVHRLVL